MLGFHLCLGTFPTAPVVNPPELSGVVRIPTRWSPMRLGSSTTLHLPVMADASADFFARLTGLEIAEPKVFLGMECNDGLGN